MLTPASLARRSVAVVLMAWCAVGLMVTAAALTGPGVWWTQGTPAPSGVVGTPMRGAAEVAVVGALLDEGGDARAGERALVVLPPGSDAFVLMYIRYQLAHLQYPRRVDVVTDVPAQLHPYTDVVVAPGLSWSGPWRQAADGGGFVRYVRGES
jgi:hypothetical protein